MRIEEITGNLKKKKEKNWIVAQDDLISAIIFDTNMSFANAVIKNIF